MDELIELIRTGLRLERQIGPKTPLLSSGIVDSLGVVTLVEAIEEHYGITIDEASVGVDTFDTPELILAQLEVARTG